MNQNIFSYMPFPWQDLLDWYRKNGRHSLPWRDYSLEENLLHYRVWISEIFLQQTQAERVVDYFQKIIQNFPDIQALSETDYEIFFPYYQGLGYYSRAKNILKTAKILQEKYQGKFPTDKKSLLELPGIGPYTSSAILAFGMGKMELTWDTNLEKIFSRFYFGTKEKKLTNSEKELIFVQFCEFVKKFKKTEQSEIIRNINNGLMDFARMIDDKKSEKIDWGNYPIKTGKWYETRGSQEQNIAKKSDIFPIPDAKIIAVLHENHKIYSSSESQKYSPFILEPSLDRNTRECVKQFFLEKYKLSVSVRPIHKKFYKNNIPFVMANVQIQTGKHNFAEFSKSDAKNILENLSN